MRKFMNPQILHNQIHMLRTHPSTKQQTILLVEGDSDSSFFKNFIDMNAVVVLACQGKGNVIGTIRKTKNVQGIIGIIDSDIDRLLGTLVNKPDNIFFLDTSDLETFILHSHALKKVLNRLADPIRLRQLLQMRGMEFQELLISEARKIGYFRLLVKVEKWPLSLKNLEFMDFFDPRTFAIDVHKLVKSVIYDRTTTHLTREKVEKQLVQFLEHEHDPWKVVSGHNLLQLVFLGLKYAFGVQVRMQKYSRQEDLEDILIPSYEYAYFKQSELYEKLMEWQIHQEDFRVFTEQN